jgi:sialic acid synthase SpsE
MRIDTIGNKPIGRSTPFLILEAGVNHEGDIGRAMEMVDAAADCGADMIKFQSYKANRLASRNSPAYWDRRQEPARSQYELFSRYDSFDIAEYEKIASRCRDRGILFCTTAFDEVFLNALAPLMTVLKVASADITNLPLLEVAAAKRMPILLSVGASYVSEIDDALRFFRERNVHKVCLMHCVLEYPSIPEHANLNAVKYLASAFPDHTVGWSDHVAPVHPVDPMLIAWLNGADILEKHFTLDKALPGNDHYHAMDPGDVAALREKLALTSQLLGKGGHDVESWELPARVHARRSIVANTDIPGGVPVTREMLTTKRPGSGLPASAIATIIGRAPRCDIKEDTQLSWNMFMGENDCRSHVQ